MTYPVCDRFGRQPPRLRHLTWRDRQRLEHDRREERARIHADYHERAELLTCILVDEAGTRGLDEAQVHEILGLAPKRLLDGTLSTPLLHAAVEHMRGLPHG